MAQFEMEEDPEYLVPSAPHPSPTVTTATKLGHLFPALRVCSSCSVLWGQGADRARSGAGVSFRPGSHPVGCSSEDII